MSGFSNLGYGNIRPFVSSDYVNSNNSHSSQFFNSKEISGGHGHGIFGAKSNIDAANSKVPRLCGLKGGGGKKKKKNMIKKSRIFFLSRKVKPNLNLNLNSKLKTRQKNTTKRKANMKSSRRRSQSRRRYRTSRHRQNQRSRQTKRRRLMKGGNAGYMQYGSNVPNTPSYSVAGTYLKPESLNLASPPPITRTNYCTTTTKM